VVGGAHSSAVLRFVLIAPPFLPPSGRTAPSGPRFFAHNRRDGSRLLSSALVIAGIGLVRFDHPLGRLVFILVGALSAYWWSQYVKLRS
jgi:hypothetical protein